MKVAARRAIPRRTACSVGWVLLGALVAGCSSDADRSTGDTSGSSRTFPTPRSPAAVSGSARGVRLVVSGDVPGSRLQEVLGDARTAVGRVRQVWGASALSGTVRIEVPADDAGFRRRGGSVEAGARIAATTTADDRVVLAPSLFTDVTEQGRRVVLTHELTHVALHQAGRTDIRRWVVEGAAEFTAYRSTALGMSRLAPQLTAQIRAGNAPDGPPSDARFTVAPEAAYQEAYAWCAFLVDRFGLHRFTGFVRSAGAADGGAFVAAFGETVAALQVPFAAFLRAQVDSSGASSTAVG